MILQKKKKKNLSCEKNVKGVRSRLMSTFLKCGFYFILCTHVKEFPCTAERNHNECIRFNRSLTSIPAYKQDEQKCWSLREYRTVQNQQSFQPMTINNNARAPFKVAGMFKQPPSLPLHGNTGRLNRRRGGRGGGWFAELKHTISAPQVELVATYPDPEVN